MNSDRPETVHDRAIAIWLLCVGAMVAAMVVIGGITRLTGSGLSMVEWRPLVGWLPPITNEQWVRTFALYQNSPEYLSVNSWMGLEDFKRIFWWEYLHRLWGRLIGLAFTLPFAWFAWRGMVRRTLVPRLLLLLVLGAIQGGIGWWMVKSGLVGEPTVSQYRLAIHLSLAFAILAALSWTAMQLIDVPRADAVTGLRVHSWIVFFLVSITMIAGAFVAGLDAGRVYNTFPLMDGKILPLDYGLLAPVWLNVFENPAAVQFNHRVSALLTLLFIIAFLVRVIRSSLNAKSRLPAHALATVAIVQVVLGIGTLLTVVPVDLAVLHQAGAVLLFCVSLWVVYGLGSSP